MKRRICIVTGTRAEYGLFYPLLKRIQKENNLLLQIVATGMHLSSKFGLTYKTIEKDGFRINEKIKILLFGDTEIGITKSVGLGISRFADVFHKLSPDAIMLLGDRFETFSAAVAAFIAKIPIIHLHGGELTEGAIDDAFRHSITKMSSLHFVATNEYRKRVIQLGENPRRVFNVGALGIDNIKNFQLLSKSELERKLKFTFGTINVLVTFHPVTLEDNASEHQFKELLSALEYFQDIKVIFTKANADTHGSIINKLIDRYVLDNPQKAVSFISLGQLRYLSAIQYVDAVVGNSSSGIIEVSSFKKPVVNIGDRQKGRILSENVVCCAPYKGEIIAALKKVFSSAFIKKCRKVKNLYGDGYAAKRIVSILKREMPKIKEIKKTFYDLKNVQK